MYTDVVRFTILFLAGAVSLAALAWSLGGVAWLLAWPALDLLVLAVAYGTDRPALLGKRADGSMSPGFAFFMAAYLLPTWAVWHLYRRLTPEPCSNEVAPGIWVGRRPFPTDLPTGTSLVIDLTAEFPVAAGVRERAEVVLAPALDARAPSPDRLRSAVERIVAADGPVYVHCAAGHGRSATVAAAAIIARGLAADVDGAQRLMKAARPGVHLHGVQRAAVRRWQDAQKPSGRQV